MERRVTWKLYSLFFNHMDAWGTTFVIVSLGLIIHQITSWAGFFLLIAITAAYWLGFAVNDYFDSAYDVLDPRKAHRNFFVHYYLSVTQITIVVGLIAVFLVIGLSLFQWQAVLVLGIGSGILWSYSSPLVRLKSRPVIDLITHMGFVQTFPYFISLYLLNISWQAIDYLLLMIFALSSLAAQLEQQTRDYEIDRLTEQNFTTWVGLAFSTRLLRGVTGLIFVLAAGGIIEGIVPIFLLPFCVMVFPALAHRFWRGLHQSRSEQLIKLSVTTAMVYIILMWGNVFLK